MCFIRRLVFLLAAFALLANIVFQRIALMTPATLTQQSPKQIWHAALGELQLQMTRATFDTWVKPTYALAYEDGTLVIGVRNAYAKQWLENRLQGTIQRTLSNLLGRSVQPHFVLRTRVGNDNESGPAHLSSDVRDHAVREENVPVEDIDSSLPNPPEEIPELRTAPSSEFAPMRAKGSTLNPKYTFTNYIVGNSNRLAHAACLAVADRPAEAYNPLFIYGGTGLGKTHLLQAVGWIPHLAGKLVVYVSSETFTNELINSIRNQNTEEFRRAYRQADVLLIDDIQFIAGKETTQEEFFHTFNSLHSANKQIVITSDRHPRGIPTLEERLRSRFEGGLIADIQPPDLETRIAILRFKAEVQPVPVPNDTIEFIARKVQNNVREMSGALTRCVAYAQLMHTALTVELATTVLQDILQHQPLSTENVIAAVAEFYRTTVDDLKGRSRNKEIVLPRQMAMYLLREETGASLPQIGDALGGRDHTTVMYSVEKMKEEIETDDQRRKDMLTIKERLYQENRGKLV